MGGSIDILMNFIFGNKCAALSGLENIYCTTTQGVVLGAVMKKNASPERAKQIGLIGVRHSSFAQC
jgi:hypothetical protein